MERKGKRAQPHLQFGVGCIDQPIAQDRMPVLNVGPTVRQGRIYVSSWNEVPRSTSKTATPTHSHTHRTRRWTQINLAMDIHVDIVTGMQDVCVYG